MRKLKKGFTLVELMIVVAMVAILAAVAIPSFLNLQDEARNALALAGSGAMRSANAIYYAKHQEYMTATQMSSAVDLTAGQYGDGVVVDNTVTWTIDEGQPCTVSYTGPNENTSTVPSTWSDPVYAVNCPTT